MLAAIMLICDFNLRRVNTLFQAYEAPHIKIESFPQKTSSLESGTFVPR